MKILKEKVIFIVNSLKYDEQDKSFNYSNRILFDSFENDNDFQLIKSKMNNLIFKLNSFENKEELNEYLNKDFETEIWENI
jgi:hypothetical protein